ncbi:hypothetical protein roselon_01324 [Roseibacterium elongatum DSM 19469]|uniref:Flagellar protein FliL n=1 Tax=Roseicyclus elongatus DSM 19469 TaxID=1294273 RepID=W8S0N1_9RHOB|nr:flagellar basal body-associated FliL family protein [Roseibacterium elongatum]AHM03712.1 hypothetical protein roselon_01324 [Roseibacterium elongatum DSM 19469]
MLRILIPILLLLVGLAGGIGAGMILGGAPPEAAADGAPDPVAPPAPPTDAAAGPAQGTSTIRVTPAGADTEYVRLNNQFIVPIIRHGMVRSLVVMALTLEVFTGDNELVFEHEPRLRDSFLRVMFAHANAGGFDGSFTEAAAMEPLRIGLREAAMQVLGDSVHDVLIVDITRQDA